MKPTLPGQSSIWWIAAASAIAVVLILVMVAVHHNQPKQMVRPADMPAISGDQLL